MISFTPDSICLKVINIIEANGFSSEINKDFLSKRLLNWKEKASLGIYTPEALLFELQQKILVNPLNGLEPLKHPVLERGWVWERSTLENYRSLVSTFYTVHSPSYASASALHEENPSILVAHSSCPCLSPFDQQEMDRTVEVHCLATEVLKELAVFVPFPPSSSALVLHVSSCELTPVNLGHFLYYYSDTASKYILKQKMIDLVWETEKNVYRATALKVDCRIMTKEIEKARDSQFQEVQKGTVQAITKVDEIQNETREIMGFLVRQKEADQNRMEHKREEAKALQAKNAQEMENLRCRLAQLK